MACVRHQATCSPNPATTMIALLLLCQYSGKTFANFEIFNRTYVPNSENKLRTILVNASRCSPKVAIQSLWIWTVFLQTFKFELEFQYENIYSHWDLPLAPLSPRDFKFQLNFPTKQPTLQHSHTIQFDDWHRTFI